LNSDLALLTVLQSFTTVKFMCRMLSLSRLDFIKQACCRTVYNVTFLHTRPGYCYLTRGRISLSSTPLLRLSQCYPTLPNYFLGQQQQQKFSSIIYPKQPLYLE